MKRFEFDVRPSHRAAQVDDVGEVTVTNDGATILKLLEVEHPAAKVLVELADTQDKEVGDGTTSVTILAAEFLKRANDLVLAKIHPTSIMAGYRLALRESKAFIKENLRVPTKALDRSFLMAAARTSMSSKIIGTHADFFAEIAVEAVTGIRRVGADGKERYPIKAINILKAHGKSATESQLVAGFALNCVRASTAMPPRVPDAKIALLDFNLQVHRMAMGIEVLVTDPEKIEELRRREADIAKEKIGKIIDAGANVILTTKAMDDLCQKYLVEAGVLGIRRVKKEDLRRIAVATGGTVIPSLADLEGDESFDARYLGQAEEVSQDRVGDGELIFLKGCKSTRSTSVVLRGANEFMLDEMERSLHDVLCVVQRVLESKSLVVGGGSVEAGLAVYLDAFSKTLGTREQLAVKAFADALLVIPKTLAVNAAKDATDLVAKLCAFHNAAQTVSGKETMRFMGLDLVKGEVRRIVCLFFVCFCRLRAGLVRSAVCISLQCACVCASWSVSGPGLGAWCLCWCLLPCCLLVAMAWSWSRYLSPLPPLRPGK